MSDFITKYILNGPVGVVLGLILGIWYMFFPQDPKDFH